MTEIKLLPNGDRLALKILGEFLGMPVDELGHPYRQGEEYEVDGQTLHRLHDWNPLDNADDCMRLMLHFKLRLSIFGDLWFMSCNDTKRQQDDAHERGDEDPEETLAAIRRAAVYKALEVVNQALEVQSLLATGREAV